MHSYEEYQEFIKQYPYYAPEPFLKDYLEALMRGDLVENVDVERIRHEIFDSTYWYSVRSIVGFVAPTLAWAREIKKVIGEGTVLEVGAGTGLLAKYLNAVGVNITATDDFSWHEKVKTSWKIYFDIKKLDFKEAIQKYRADYLLLCWPYMDSLAWKASEMFTKLNPEGKILYIGEGYEGCTADGKFFDGTVVLDYMEETNKLFPQWSGLHDRCELRKWIGVPSDYDKLKADDAEDIEEEVF